MVQRILRWQGWRRVGWRRLAIEYALLKAVLFLYTMGRFYAATTGERPYENARALMGFEASLGLFFEEAVQDAVRSAGGLVHAANWYYAQMHFAPMMALLVWVFMFRRPSYTLVRNAFLASTLAGMVLQVVVPMAPPRLMPESGLVDTLAVHSSINYDRLGTFANQFAAMPSIHWGWSAFQAAVFIGLTKSAWRWLAVLHPALMLVVIVATGNHFWLDAAVSVPVMGLPAVGLVWLARWRRQRVAMPAAMPATDPMGAPMPVPADEGAQG